VLFGRSWWSVSVIVAGVLIGTCACGFVAERSPSTPTPSTTESTSITHGGDRLLPVLGELSVRSKVPLAGYSRDLFGPAWTDDNSNFSGHSGCDERNDSLKRSMTDLVIKPGTRGCVVLSGTLLDPYTGLVIHFVRGPNSAAAQVDHVVSEANSYQTGAQQLGADQRQDFATDPLNLIVTDGPTNQSKGDSDASEWLPVRHRCLYVARQIAVKAKWGLWVTSAEKAAMLSVLSDCPAQPLPTEASADVVGPIPAE